MNLINQLLIATPDMEDDRFKKAVILVCDHGENGAMGININHPSEVAFEEVLTSLKIDNNNPSDFPQVQEGGPVNTECGFILHNSGLVFESSIRISSQLRLTTSKDIIQAIANQELPNEWLLALGCATWHQGQLEQEIADNAWLLCPANEHIVFDRSQDKWQDALGLLGIQAHQISSDIGHA